MNPIIIIPARLDSKRFPQKMLHSIKGIPLILATARNASAAFGVENIVIATCDHEIKEVVKDEFQICFTSSDHKTGTDRVCEAVQILKITNDRRIINLQGDQPDILPKDIVKLNTKNDDCINTGYCEIDVSEATRSNLVKIVFNKENILKYASRSPIPYNANVFNKHIGIFGFYRHHLEKFALTKRSVLEESEDIEILRFLDTDIIVKCYKMSDASSIDVYDDIRKFQS